MTATVRLEIATSVATLTLARPPLNAISEELLRDIDEALDRIAASGAHVLRIRSATKAFSAGADLGAVSAVMDAADPAAEMTRFVQAFHRVNNRIAALDAVSIAEIDGAALGGGLELALACDFRIATERARLGLPETTLGLLPGAGGTFRLRLVAGLPLARRMILKGETLSAEEALQHGLVDQLLRGSEDEIRSGFEAFASAIAGNAREAVLAAKRCLAVPPEQGEAKEIAEIASLVTVEETQKRVRAFLNR